MGLAFSIIHFQIQPALSYNHTTYAKPRAFSQLLCQALHMSRGRDSAGSSLFPSPITFLELTTKGMLLKSPSPFSANDSEQDCSTLSSAGKERGNPSCDITPFPRSHPASPASQTYSGSATNTSKGCGKSPFRGASSSLGVKVSWAWGSRTGREWPDGKRGNQHHRAQGSPACL